MRTQRIGVAVPADQLALELPGLHRCRRSNPHPAVSVDRCPAAAADQPVSVVATAVGERVWLVWEDDEVFGIYADPDTAAAECTALRRHAHRERLQVHYEWMAVPVFTGRRHQPSTAEVPRVVTGRRW